MKKFKIARMLIPDKNFVPCPMEEGDEFCPNGIFVFNITKMIEFIKSNPDKFVPESIEIKDYHGLSTINEDYMGSANNPDPIILAEISPSRYNTIDGRHRMEKAHRAGATHILAYRLAMEHHIAFLTSRKAYDCYVEYWNDKLLMLHEKSAKGLRYKPLPLCLLEV